jgi:hypothetical protein
MFRVVPHPSSGAHATVSTASGIYQTVTATCRYSGRKQKGLQKRHKVTVKPIFMEIHKEAYINIHFFISSKKVN